MKGKRGMEVEVLAWFIIAAFVLIVLLVSYFILKDKGIGAIDFVKNMFRFGR